MPHWLRVLKNHAGAKVKDPSYQGDAGFNVYCVEPTVLVPGRITEVPLGFQMALPPETVCTLITRSGAVKRGLFVLPGLIDEGYRGPMFLHVLNTNTEEVKILPGESIAQIVLLANLARGTVVSYESELPPSQRGYNGFGSTGH